MRCPVVLVLLVAGNMGCAAVPFTPWTIQYSVSGGLIGLRHSLTLDDSGSVTVIDGNFYDAQARFSASPTDMAAITGTLRLMCVSAPPPMVRPERPMPDAIENLLQVTCGGRTFRVGKEGASLLALLRPMMSRGLQQAIDEKWATAGPFRPGRTWSVKIEVRDDQGMFHGEYWRGVWTREGDSDTFDAFWNNTRTGAEVRETVSLELAERGTVVLHRTSLDQTLKGGYSPDHPEKIAGYLMSPHWYWEATIQGQ